MSKLRLMMFDPILYPRKVWVAIGGTIKQLQDRFTDEEGNELDEDTTGFAAKTGQAKSKETGNLGVLIWFPKTEDVKCGNIAHEAVHAALFIANEMGFRVEVYNDEPIAYLVGWIAGCINAMKTNTVKVLNK